MDNNGITGITILVGGWSTPLKNDGVKVSWDDEIPYEIPNIYIYMEKMKSKCSSHHQPVQAILMEAAKWVQFR